MTRNGAARVSAIALLLTIAVAAAAPAASLRSAHYDITWDGGALGDLDALSRELEARFAVYESVFRFDPAALREPFRVRVFTDQAAYDGYVSVRVGRKQAGVVYLHYVQEDKRELVILRGGAGEASMLPHQAFIQYLRGFVPNPPSWIREGFAIYFTGYRYDQAAKSLVYEEYLDWLPRLKELGAAALPPRALLEADYSGASQGDDFQICSWSLVSFFLNASNRDYYRALTECFLLLNPQASAADNAAAVVKRLSLWTDFDALARETRAYVESRKTFDELMDTGRAAYAAKDALNAELGFLAALDLRPNDYRPYYYLGLIYFDEESYDLADTYFRDALDRGAAPGLTSYALGVNAAAALKSGEAVEWFRKAAADPAYKAKADQQIEKLGGR